MELRGEAAGVRVYDDFAHHPTAIATTLQGLRAQVGSETRIFAVLEPRSNTMRMGVHAEQLPAALATADQGIVYAPADLGWDASALFSPFGEKVRVFHSVAEILSFLSEETRTGDQVLIMSNGGFEGIHRRLLEMLQSPGELA